MPANPAPAHQAPSQTGTGPGPRALLSPSVAFETLTSHQKTKGDTPLQPQAAFLPLPLPGGFSLPWQNLVKAHLLLGVFIAQVPRPQSFLHTWTTTAHRSLCRGSYQPHLLDWDWGVASTQHGQGEEQLDLPQNSEGYREIQWEETK